MVFSGRRCNSRAVLMPSEQPFAEGIDRRSRPGHSWGAAVKIGRKPIEIVCRRGEKEHGFDHSPQGQIAARSGPFARGLSPSGAVRDVFSVHCIGWGSTSFRSTTPTDANPPPIIHLNRSAAGDFQPRSRTSLAQGSALNSDRVVPPGQSLPLQYPKSKLQP